MSLWRHQAFERFPELRSQLQESKTAMNYWIELQFAFDEAYRKGNVDLFRRILEYSDWCFHAPRGKSAEDNLPSCILVCLFEHMPMTSAEQKLDRNELGLSLLAWDGPTITHPHVKALYENLLKRQTSLARKVKNS